MGLRLRPLRNLVHVARITETVTPGGIHIPQDYKAIGSRKAVNKPDYFRAKVLAIGPQVRDLAEGDEVLVYSWSDKPDGSRRGLYVGVDGPDNTLLVEYPEDIVCAQERAG